MIPQLRIILSNVNFFVCCLLAFLLIADGGPFAGWFHVMGRMHPLLLHFPIALIVIYSIWKLASPKSNSGLSPENFSVDDILLVGSLSASVSALMGLILSKEGIYTADGIFWHKWLGSFTAFGAYLWYSYRSHLIGNKILNRFIPVIVSSLVITAGHFGATITHGENFVIAPIINDDVEEDVLFENAEVFTHLVQPILKRRCSSCHNSRKAKGELVMETYASLVAGGKSGQLWDTTNTDQGLILSRIFLPEDDEEHMPPLEKSQLSDFEIEVIEEWISDGALFGKLAAGYSPDHPLYKLTFQKFSSDEPKYAFEDSDPELIRSLNNFYRSVSKIAFNSPALSVNFFPGHDFSLDQIRELEKIKYQIVDLNLSKMLLPNGALANIGQFENLEKLNLNFTGAGDNLRDLSNLQELKEIALSGVALDLEDLIVFEELHKLEKAYLWNSGLSKSDIKKLKTRLPNVEIEMGFDASNVVIPLPAPLVRNKKKIFFEHDSDLAVDHNIPDVELRYTLDGSEPDSLESPVYNNDLKLSGNMAFKIKAFKKGWKASETVSQTFLQGSIEPEKVKLLTEPEKKYSGKGAETLFDGEEGTFYHADGRWIGYEGRSFEVLITLKDTLIPKSITISCLYNSGPSIMRPTGIEVWYGNDPENLDLWKKESMDVPGESEPKKYIYYEYDLPETNFEYIKLVVDPIAKLPDWHNQKGNPGWIFIDELLLN